MIPEKEKNTDISPLNWISSLDLEFLGKNCCQECGSSYPNLLQLSLQSKILDSRWEAVNQSYSLPEISSIVCSKKQNKGKKDLIVLDFLF